MTLIRVALIGLSASAKTSWAEQSHLAYLLSPRGRKHYQITALLNSSQSAAEAARAHFKLPASVKTYGDPAALAADPDVDLVVCNTRVDVHFPTTAPSLHAGKVVFIEWPLTENLAKSLELTQGKAIPDSIIGLQGRVSPPVLRVKEILASGALGTVLNTEIKTYGNLLQNDSFPASLTYFGDRRVGGHQLNIAFGHMIDFVHDAVGEFAEFQSRLAIHRPVKKAVDGEGKEVGEVRPDVPDYLALHGTLKPGRADVAENATLVATFRHGKQFKGEPGLVWSIHGTKGELLLTGPGPYLNSDSYNGDINIRLHDYATDEVRDMGWDWEDWQKELPLRARHIGELYERYAAWVEAGKPEEVEEGKRWPTLDDAVVRMREFDGLYKQFDPAW